MSLSFKILPAKIKHSCPTGALNFDEIISFNCGEIDEAWVKSQQIFDAKNRDYLFYRSIWFYFNSFFWFWCFNNNFDGHSFFALVGHDENGDDSQENRRNSVPGQSRTNLFQKVRVWVRFRCDSRWRFCSRRLQGLLVICLQTVWEAWSEMWLCVEMRPKAYYLNRLLRRCFIDKNVRGWYKGMLIIWWLVFSIFCLFQAAESCLTH